MNVRCPSCQTTFRVDPARVPAAGVKARCSKCSAVFRLEPHGASAIAAPASPSVAPARAQPPAAAPAPMPPAPSPFTPPPMPPTPIAPMAPAATFVATPPAPAPVQPAASPAPPRPAPVPAAAEPVSPAPAATGAKRPSFRNQDPNARAQRIARALVSDIVAYNKSKLKESLDAGTLRNEFREEIRKSWEEYVEQVGLEMAKNTPYFRDSLNEILAKGQKVF